MSALSDSTNMPEAVRTNKLKTVMGKALAETRKVINEDVVKSIYGDLATPELTELVTSVMDGVNERVSVEFDSIVASHDINKKLLKLEELIEKAGTENGQTINNAAFASLLPDGVTPQDVLRMNTHEMKLAERERLIAALDKANDAVVGEIEDGKKQLAVKLQEIETQRLEMQKTADICTMSS
ncbi:hypothetical protein TrCOL_g11547 [Triparma columacea]|uniref:Uncharacterized protein n=1 Tax=Triparma columacea TaxID=722753 RepID=A0A9W7L8P4_9STRA|nr:hypothetical protein TrCOL_g11547 [Triparma columacea]